MSANPFQRQMAKLIIESEARFHPDGARRFLARNRDGDYLRLEPAGLWVVPGYRFQMFYQLALRHVYQMVEVQQRIRQDPEFSAWILDALYWPQSVWRNRSSLALDSLLFRRYLCEQIQHDEVLGSVTLPRSEENIQFLHETVLRLVYLLRFPRHLFRACATTTPDAAESVVVAASKLTELFCVGLSRPLLSQEIPEELEFRDSNPFVVQWEFSFFGEMDAGRGEIQRCYLDSIRRNRLDETIKSRFSQLHNFLLDILGNGDGDVVIEAVSKVASAVASTPSGSAEVQQLVALRKVGEAAIVRLLAAMELHGGEEAKLVCRRTLCGDYDHGDFLADARLLLDYQFLQQGLLEKTRPVIAKVIILLSIGRLSEGLDPLLYYDSEILPKFQAEMCAADVRTEHAMVMAPGGQPDFEIFAERIRKCVCYLLGR